MTHGDKAKAKAGKTSQASGSKSSKAVAGKEDGNGKSGKSSKAESGKSVNEGKTREAGRKGSSKASVQEASPKSSKSSGAKTSAEAAGKSSSAAEAAAAAKGRRADGGFNNPVIADAYRRALEKYPNAFRKLTD